jgi:hypothetical protein
VVSYYEFVFSDGTTAGLLRRTVDNKKQTSVIEAVKGGQWADDPDAIKYFEPFWGDQLEVAELDADEAQARADELGVAL